MHFDICIIFHIHNSTIIQNHFTVLRIPCASLFIPTPPADPMTTTDHFTLSIILLYVAILMTIDKKLCKISAPRLCVLEVYTHNLTRHLKS